MSVQSIADVPPLTPSKEKILSVPVSQVQPNDWNPNEMHPQLFNALSEDVKAEGMDQPVVVREVDGKYVIVDGEHRYRAAMAAGAENILVSVKPWSEDEAKLHTIRRNALRGENNPAKFTKLVADLNNKGISMEDIKKRMSIPDKEFARLYLGPTDAKTKTAGKLLENADKGQAQTFAVANLSQMIRDIVAQYGESIGQGFVAFSFKGKTHLMVSMDSTLQKAVTAFVQSATEDGLTQEQISAKLTQVFKSLV